MSDDQSQSKFKTFEAALTTKDVGALVPMAYGPGDSDGTYGPEGDE